METIMPASSKTLDSLDYDTTDPSLNSKMPKSPTPQESAYNLTPEQLQRFKEDGYIVLSDLVPRELLQRALYDINKCIGKGIPVDQIEKFNLISWCDELREHPSMTSLFQNTTVRAVINSFLGQENLPEETGGRVQIALKFPTDPPATKPEKFRIHIDGIPTTVNGLAQGQLYPFTMLVGVYLNDIQDEDAGNLVVYPGTHRTLAEYFSQDEHGPESFLETRMLYMTIPKPVQLKVKAGDVVFAHYLLLHSVSSNVSPNIRYAIYSRVFSKLQDQHDAEEKYKSMKHVWIDWPVYQDKQ
eukprot:TRINITY_DN2958_c0_g1_i1.p2 TRINITY_DN2958_c0_g1~~TRINITY_DN2958_c0_g1_i1.p2  ORF type:complete len:299 (-),score=66.51 TRINITY_DN2958_c0_g1_i1:58-954(-)